MKLTGIIGDHVCIFLGCYSPMILRPGGSGQFQVVGEAYVHGLEDAVGILGPLPSNWRAIIRGDDVGRPLHRYLNLRTFEQTAEDPRLGPLPPGWERVAYERSLDDPAIFEMFSSSVTGETITSDPRLSPEALQLRGVKLETFQLS
jgi:hypothetical protein